MGLFNKNKDIKSISDDEKEQNNYFSNVFDEVDKEIQEERDERIRKENEAEKARNERIQKIEATDICFNVADFKGFEKPYEPDADGKMRFVLDNCQPYSVILSEIQEIDGSTIIASGRVFGTVNSDSDSFIYLPSGKIVKTTLGKIYDKDLNPVDSIKDDIINIKVAKEPKRSIPRFTVLSSFCSVAKDSQVMTNPLMYAYTLGFKELHNDSEFSSVFVYTFVHTKFSTPAIRSEDGRPGFLMLKPSKDAATAELPLFTDIQSMTVAEKKMNTQQGNNKVAAVVSFVGVAKNLLDAGNGIVINPFTPCPIMIPNKLIREITEIESFRKEFNFGQ